MAKFRPLLAPLLLSLLLAGVAAASDPLAELRSRVTKSTLANGLRVLIVNRDISPVFVGQTWVKVGGVDEREGITGIAHFFEHMAFKGTRTVGTRDFNRESGLLAELERLVLAAENQEAVLRSAEATRVTATLKELWIDNEFSKIYVREGGNGLNAGTAKDFTYYTVALPRTAFELWSWMESERFLHPVFRQFYEEREVIQEERRSSYDDDPDGRLYELLLETAFTIHPYRLPNIGYPRDLKHITATDMSAFYQRYYRPDNTVLVVVGDLAVADALPVIERYFSRLERPDVPLPEVNEVEPPQRAERTAVLQFDAEPRLMMGYLKPTYPSPDDAYFALLHDLLAGRRTSLLYRELVEKRRLATSVSTTEAPGLRFPPLFLVAATPQSGVSTHRLRDEIQALMENFAANPIPPADLEGAKRRVRRSYLDHLGSSGGLAEVLGQAELLHNDWREVFTVYHQILSATESDVRNLVRKYLTVSQRTYVHLEKKPHQ